MVEQTPKATPSTVRRKLYFTLLWLTVGWAFGFLARVYYRASIIVSGESWAVAFPLDGHGLLFVVVDAFAPLLALVLSNRVWRWLRRA